MDQFASRKPLCCIEARTDAFAWSITVYCAEAARLDAGAPTSFSSSYVLRLCTHAELNCHFAECLPSFVYTAISFSPRALYSRCRKIGEWPCCEVDFLLVLFRGKMLGYSTPELDFEQEREDAPRQSLILSKL